MNQCHPNKCNKKGGGKGKKIQCDNLCLLTGVFNPFTFNVIVDVVGLTCCFAIVFSKSQIVFIPSLLPSFLFRYFLT